MADVRRWEGVGLCVVVRSYDRLLVQVLAHTDGRKQGVHCFYARLASGPLVTRLVQLFLGRSIPSAIRTLVTPRSRESSPMLQGCLPTFCHSIYTRSASFLSVFYRRPPASRRISASTMAADSIAVADPGLGVDPCRDDVTPFVTWSAALTSWFAMSPSRDSASLQQKRRRADGFLFAATIASPRTTQERSLPTRR